jgi:dTDP-4-dehydrorhamnose 3,5-epimerase-like enzyme
MRFSETTVQGAQVIQIDRITDARGLFARVRCQDEFAEYGIMAAWVRANVRATGNCGRGPATMEPESSERQAE